MGADRDAPGVPRPPEETRPALEPGLSPEEFARWYWLKRELQAFAVRIGVSAAGSKQDLAARIARRLAGAGDPGDDAWGRTRARPSVDALPDGPLSRETVVPAGQRMTARLRAFMVGECGPGFRFDARMRQFFAAGGDRTLGDAVDHWHATRDAPRPEIASQFEYNAFARAWRQANPGRSHAEMVAAWTARKRLPADRRPPIA